MSDEEKSIDASSNNLKAKFVTEMRRMNWKIVIIVQAIIVQAIGWWWCLDKWGIEAAYHIVVPGIGTTASLLGFHVIGSIAMVFVTWALEYKTMRSMQYFHIEHVYKEGEEPRYGVGGSETEDDLDSEDLEREKWFGKPYDAEYINIDREDMDLLFQNETSDTKILTKDQIKTALDKYVPGKDANGKTTPFKNPGRVELGHEPEGLPAYFYYVTYNRPAFHGLIGQKNGKAKSFVDCIEITHVPWDREFRFKRRTIPGRGFNVKCPNTERKELAHVETLLGDLMVFNVTTSHYVRKEATRKIRPSDDVLAGGLLKIVTFFYNLRKADVKPKEDLIDSMRAESVAYNNAVKNARLDVLARLNMRRYQSDRENQLARAQHQHKENSDTATVLAYFFGIALAIIVVLLIIGVL